MYKLALNLSRSSKLSGSGPIYFLYFSTASRKIACFSLFLSSWYLEFWVNSVKNFSLFCSAKASCCLCDKNVVGCFERLILLKFYFSST